MFAGAAGFDSAVFVSSGCLVEGSAGAGLMIGAFDGALIGLAGAVLEIGRGGAFGSGFAAVLGDWFSAVGISSSWTEK